MALFGFEFSSKSMIELASEILTNAIPQGQGPRLVFTANVDHIVQMRRVPEFRAAYNRAWVRTIDGFPVHLLARIEVSRAIPRVTGADLFTSLMLGLDPLSHRCFFVVNSAATADGISRYLLSQGFNRDAIQFSVPQHGFELDPAFSNALASEIRSHGTTHLFLAVGAPKSEIWCDRHAEALGNCYALCVGAGPEFFLGLKRRAPRIWREYGFEWLWRFLHEPRRLFRRYFVDSWSFLVAVAEDHWGRGTAPRASNPGTLGAPPS